MPIDETAYVQGLIDASTRLPGRDLYVTRVKVVTEAQIEGVYRKTRLIALDGTVGGGVLELAEPSTNRAWVRNIWIDGNKAGADMSGIFLNSTGAIWPGGGTEIVLEGVTVTNTRRHGIHLLNATATRLRSIRVRSPDGDGIVVDATDVQLDCQVSPAFSGAGVSVLQHCNMLGVVKVGECLTGVYFGPKAFSNSADSLVIDNTSGDGLVVNGNYNQISAALSRPNGRGLVLNARGCVITGSVTRQGGSQTYPVVLDPAAADNSVIVGAQVGVLGFYSGPTTNNNVIINGRPYATVA